jgi:quercetin dioxygenase-like cupin family protein
MKNGIIVDLNDRENSWLYPMKMVAADGRLVEESSTIAVGEGPDSLFCFTDARMYAIPDGRNPDDVISLHEHRVGYETFFIDSGRAYLYTGGKKCLVTKGDILCLQPYQAHGTVFVEPAKHRGSLHNMHSANDTPAISALMGYEADALKNPEVSPFRSGGDFFRRERPVFKEVPAAEVAAVRNPARPTVFYEFEGVTMKQISARWENGGVCELWCADMAAGFHAEWMQCPKHREQLYVREGEVRITVYGEDYTAYAGCLVNIPKFASHSLTALSRAEVYDCCGQTMWEEFLQDYTSIRTYDPGRLKNPETLAALKERYGCQIRSVGFA